MDDNVDICKIALLEVKRILSENGCLIVDDPYEEKMGFELNGIKPPANWRLAVQVPTKLTFETISKLDEIVYVDIIHNGAKLNVWLLDCERGDAKLDGRYRRGNEQDLRTVLLDVSLADPKCFDKIKDVVLRRAN